MRLGCGLANGERRAASCVLREQRLEQDLSSATAGADGARGTARGGHGAAGFRRQSAAKRRLLGLRAARPMELVDRVRCAMCAGWFHTIYT